MDPHDPLAQVRAAYDSQAFASQGHRLVDLLAESLAASASGQGAVLPWLPPQEQRLNWPVLPGSLGNDAAIDALWRKVTAASQHLHHPRYVGHQVTAPLPLLSLADLVSSHLNNSMAVYEMGPASTAMEQNVVAFLAQSLGFSETAGGVLTSGGSAGNLTGLLAARQAQAGFDVWTEGVHAAPRPLAFLVSQQCHYSIARSLQIMGLGKQAAIPVPVDAAFRMRPEALGPALEGARRRGLQVIGVAASAGSTATGAFDPLDPIADFCAANGLWLHVDGAHGASVAFSQQHKHKLLGIERADSVVWDAHKMLLTPALVTAVLFREGKRSQEAFAQEASYLFSPETGDGPSPDIAGRTLECTKLMLSLKLWLGLSAYGPDFLGAYIDGMFALAQDFAADLAEAPDFELAVRPEANIVCFRYIPPGAPLAPQDLDALQSRLRTAVVHSGQFYLVQTGLPRGTFLRTTLINPFTRRSDLGELLAALRAAAKA